MQEQTYPSLILGMPEDEYHARPEISKSGLDLINKAPKLYHWHHIDAAGEPFNRTPAMQLGSFVHTATLEPNLWGNDYIRQPKFGRKKAELEAAEEFAIENADKVVVPADMYEHAVQAAIAVRKHPIAASLLREGEAEVSMLARDEETGLGIRGRADWVRPSGSLVDLKTSRSAERRSYWYSVRDYRYDVQAAFYLDLAKRCGVESEEQIFYWIVVEPKPPYMVAVYWASTGMVAAGREKYILDLATYKACLDTNKWPGYGEDGELGTEAPRWTN